MVRILSMFVMMVVFGGVFAVGTSAGDDWRVVYSESFDRLPAGTRTTSKALQNWEGGSAAGVVFDGGSQAVGRFLVASSAWTSFNQGPILQVDLTAVPHDRVRVQCDLYTFGDWRGNQQATGGPQHRIMFFDSKAEPRFSFATTFATNKAFSQSWPNKSPATNKALTGAEPVTVDTTGRFTNSHRWPIEFEYASDSPALRFTVLCGAGAGSGAPMPHFGIDNVKVFVHSTAPTIDLADRPNDIRLARNNPPPKPGSLIEIDIPASGRTSVGVFDRSSGRLIRSLWNGERSKAGKHSIPWDGLDNQGRPVAAATYEWRAITTPGFRARYVNTIGINPPGGEHPQPRRSWVGDHVGGGIVDVDDSGVYVGSPTTEGLMMLLKVGNRRPATKAEPSLRQQIRGENLDLASDAHATDAKVVWRREQFYQSGRLTKAATSGMHVFMLHPNGKLRRLNRDSGRVETEWQIASDGKAPIDIDAHGDNLVVADPLQNQLTWLSSETGEEVASVPLQRPSCVAAIEDSRPGLVVAASKEVLYRVAPDGVAKQVAVLSGTINALDFDPQRKELWAVVDGHKIVRLDEQFHVTRTYGDRPREFGPYDPTRFAGIYDVAADLKGGFFIGEPGHPPRRIAHLARDGSVIKEWFGGMSFYVNGTFDPEDPSRLIGIAPEGMINVYRINLDSGAWTIEATYATGRLGDGLFPNAGSYRAIRRNGNLYLYHRVIPAVVRLDSQQRRAVPVAIAGRVLNKGRTFFQFAGTGRDGYPKPWVEAAERNGFTNLKRAPKLYSWADSDGDGEFDAEEFQFYPDAPRGLSFHNPGDFRSNGDYIGGTKTNEAQALVHLPVGTWEGPQQDAPRWDWNRVKSVGEIEANSYGFGSPRGVSVGPDDSVAVAYQAGIMIREHGQYEGGRWPEAAMRGSRVLAFDSQLQPTFAVGRQSKDGSESSTGVLYYPMQTAFGRNQSVIINDQTKQPAQVWTRDGLYVGGLFDHRADDGRDAGFYQVHGDDNQGATMVTSKTGQTYWLMPYQGHNRLFQITGWEDWQRQAGLVQSPAATTASKLSGSGLTARYRQESKLVLESVEPPIYFEPFGGEPHAKEISPFYQVSWTGFVEPPATDRYDFQSLLGKAEQVAVWIDGRLVHAHGFNRQDADRVDENHSVDLTARHRHRIHIEYINPDGRAELKLLWSSRVIDPQRIPTERLFPVTMNHTN